jgi:hypothetical protein
MQLPALFTYQQRQQIPVSSGIYAFYVDFAFIARAMRRPGATVAQFESLLNKVSRAHTASNPKDTEFNVFGRTRTFTAVYSLQASHIIRRGTVPAGFTVPQVRQLALLLDKCAFLTAPIYVGIAEHQTLIDRYEQHRHKYGHIKATSVIRAGRGRDAFQRSGSFPANLVRRGIQFRHLVFACYPLTPAEITYVRFVEKLFHAISNPSLSESH